VQDLLVVTASDGRELLVPFVEQIVPEVNVGDGYVVVTPPPGLFEVNAEDEAKPEDKPDADGAEASGGSADAGDNA
jgi:16S rRNA processing protein RimM